MTRIALTRATVFDSATGALRPNGTVIVEGERIVDVLHDATPVDDARVVDLDGRTLLPFHANLLQAAIATATPVQPVALRFSLGLAAAAVRILPVVAPPRLRAVPGQGRD